MRLSDLGPGACEDAFRAWRAGSGPFLPYVKSTPFVALARFAGELELLEAAPFAGGLPSLEPGELLVIDLPGSSALAAGLAAWERLRLWPVIAFSHWFHPHGIVGDAETASLLLQPPVLADDAAAGWAFVIDYDRYREEPLSPERFNNQYELTEDDLPTVEELRELGYTGVCLVTEQTPKEDLQRYAAYLAAGQLGVRWHS